MSITASIDEPQNNLEANFNLPICSESLYREIILPFAQNYNLPLCKGWGTMTEISNESFPDFKNQLLILLKEIASSEAISQNSKIHLNDRISKLYLEMDALLQKRSSAIFLIG